jgi:hypothetical protein
LASSADGISSSFISVTTKLKKIEDKREVAMSGQEVLQAARLPSGHSSKQYFTSLA